MSNDNKIKEFEKQLTGSPSERKKALVDFIRHLRMDGIKINASDNAIYITTYTSIMRSISADYPFLNEEVERQISKKIRWQTRRSKRAERVS